jgi:hypothetical protein
MTTGTKVLSDVWVFLGGKRKGVIRQEPRCGTPGRCDDHVDEGERHFAHASCAAHWTALLDEDDPSTPTTTPGFIA